MRKTSSTQGSPRSSTSPSLAGTRSKRSLKIPARFHDTEFAFRDVAEALRMKGNREVKDEDLTKAAIEELEKSKCYSPSSSASTTRASTPAPSSTPSAGTPQQSSSPPTTTPAAVATATRNSTGGKNNSSSKRENEDKSEGETPVKVLKGAFRPSVTYKKQTVSFSAESSSSTLTSSSNKSAASGASSRPLVEHIPNTEAVPPAKVTTSAAATQVEPSNRSSSSKKKSSSHKKKSVSQTLPVKAQSQQEERQEKQQQQQDFATPCNNNVGASINSITITPALQQNHKPQLQQLLQQPTSQSLNFQQPRPIQGPPFGTRLLPVDQPVYLPISVGNIAPITATMPLIANAARRPPFVSKKASACLKYQDSLKMSSLLSSHQLLVRMARHLCVKDRLALRAASKTWCSIVDSEVVWKKVHLTPEDLTLNWDWIVGSYFNRYRTTDVILKEPADTESYHRLVKLVSEKSEHLERVWLRSVNREQNTIIYNILTTIEQSLIDACQRSNNDIGEATLPRFLKFGVVNWHVAVGVYDTGNATVELLGPAIRARRSEQEDEAIIEVELNDLRAELDWPKKLNQPQNAQVAKALISPI